MRIESGVDALQRERAANQQAGADEQQQRQRDLGDDQARAQPIAEAAARRSAAALAQAHLHVGAREPQRGREAADDARDEPDRDRKAECHRIDPRLIEAGHVPRARRDDARDEPVREQQAGAGGGERQQHAFGQQLPHDTHAPDAERRADRDLAPARRAAREQQVRHVAARDEQHDEDGAEQHEEPRAVAADDVLAERFHRVAQLGDVAREIVPHANRHRLELLQRLLARDAALQPAVHRQVVLVVHRLALGCERDRNPQWELHDLPGACDGSWRITNRPPPGSHQHLTCRTDWAVSGLVGSSVWSVVAALLAARPRRSGPRAGRRRSGDGPSDRRLGGAVRGADGTATGAGSE